MYRLYTVSGRNTGYENPHFEDIHASEDPQELLEQYQRNPDNEHVKVELFYLDGFEITVKKREV